MDTDAVLELIRDVAAQVITPRFRSLARGDVEEKNPGDLVTVADREAEELLTAALLADDPGVLVVGEEATAADPGLLERLVDAPHAFTVDPVDGTRNFVHGSPDYAVMVAELRGGVPVRAWIYQPEHERAFVAERGAGVRRDGEPLPLLSSETDPARLRVLTSSPPLEGRHGDLTLDKTAWSCGIDYPWLAEGRAHAIVYTRTMPWDHAPGSLIVSELGGVVRRHDGSPYEAAQAVQQRRGGILAAASPATWDAVAAHLSDVMTRR